ncbi:putative DNA-binding protein (UPF0251 family) [Constrictibacter sp. MBR-5]|jgi:predicted DNA-binding protein (UPF0251 family)|uniref:hypothetical protein n=1 Tax=Constrictibacter sp. MBR-5 TaxID=3156467 RepID=UPI00339A9FBD
MMFDRNRLPDIAVDPAIDAPSPAAIAASVKRPAALIEAEANSRRLRDARELAHEEARALVGNRGDMRTGRAAEVRIAELEAARLELERQINAARPALLALRREHAARVRKALEPAMRQAATVAVRAIAELTAALTTLEAAEVEINRPIGGARDRHWRIPQGLGALENAARRAAARAK